jgi:hypothetical protein
MHNIFIIFNRRSNIVCLFLTLKRCNSIMFCIYFLKFTKNIIKINKINKYTLYLTDIIPNYTQILISVTNINLLNFSMSHTIHVLPIIKII